MSAAGIGGLDPVVTDVVCQRPDLIGGCVEAAAAASMSVSMAHVSPFPRIFASEGVSSHLRQRGSPRPLSHAECPEPASRLTTPYQRTVA